MCKEIDAEWEALREELDTEQRSEGDDGRGGERTDERDGRAEPGDASPVAEGE